MQFASVDPLQCFRTQVLLGQAIRVSGGMSRELLAGDLPWSRVSNWAGAITSSTSSGGEGLLGLQGSPRVDQGLHPVPRRGKTNHLQSDCREGHAYQQLRYPDFSPFPRP